MGYDFLWKVKDIGVLDFTTGNVNTTQMSNAKQKKSSCESNAKDMNTMGQNDNFITRQPDGKIYPACATRLLGKFGRSFSYELRLEVPQKSLELMLSDGLHVLGLEKVSIHHSLHLLFLKWGFYKGLTVWLTCKSRWTDRFVYLCEKSFLLTNIIYIPLW